MVCKGDSQEGWPICFCLEAAGLRLNTTGPGHLFPLKLDLKISGRHPPHCCRLPGKESPNPIQRESHLAILFAPQHSPLFIYSYSQEWGPEWGYFRCGDVYDRAIRHSSVPLTNILSVWGHSCLWPFQSSPVRQQGKPFSSH